MRRKWDHKMQFLSMLTNPPAFLTGCFCGVGALLVQLNHENAGMALIVAAIGMGHRLVPEPSVPPAYPPAHEAIGSPPIGGHDGDH